jgi:cell division protein FtsB
VGREAGDVSRAAPSHGPGAKGKAAKAKASKAKDTKTKDRAAGTKASERGPATAKSEGKHRSTASPKLRRRRFVLVASGAFAALVLGTSFPASGLLSDHHQLASTDTALHRLKAQNHALAQENQQLNSKAEIHSLARQDYQLVDPGQTAYNVLPPTSQSTKTGSSAVTGDPGNQPVVAPANAAGMSPDPDVPTTTTTSPASTATAPASSGSATTPTTEPPTTGGFWSRTLHSLEFWR